MNDLVAMRHKYWSQQKTLWPTKRSKVAVPFCWEGMIIDKEIMQHVRGAVSVGEWGHANYYLTQAYFGGPENDAFWNQFI